MSYLDISEKIASFFGAAVVWNFKLSFTSGELFEVHFYRAVSII